MYKLAIFDFDGTIADTDEIRYKAYAKLAKKNNLREINEEEAKKLQLMSAKDQLKYMNIPKYKIPGMIKQAFEVYAEFIESAPLFPGIPDLLEELKKQGIITAILSSNSERNIKKFLNAHGIKHFNEIYGKASLFGKHSAIKSLLKKLGFKNEESIYIGDEVRDVNSCKKINVKVAAVSWGYDPRQVIEQSDPDYLADTADELTDIITGKKL